MKAEDIAASLSDAQKDAVLGIFSWPSPWEQDRGEAELYRLGIWGPHGGRSKLGNAVRSHLMKERGE